MGHARSSALSVHAIFLSSHASKLGSEYSCIHGTAEVSWASLLIVRIVEFLSDVRGSTVVIEDS